MPSILQNIQHVRRLVPARSVPALAERRAEKLWENEAFAANQIAEMEFLLGKSERASEVPELARAFTVQMQIRTFMRWHPRAITRQRVKGMEWLTTKRDPGRSVILSFTHHHRYEAMFPSFGRLGVPMKMVINPEIARPEAGIQFAQHLRVAGRFGGTFVTTEGGTKKLAAELTPGAFLGLAPDFPGNTPVTWLGRQVMGSFGTAKLATTTNSQVVLATVRRDAEGPYVQVDPPLEPSDFPDGEALLNEVLRRHGEAILEWPEAVDSPTARFGRVAEE